MTAPTATAVECSIAASTRRQTTSISAPTSRPARRLARRRRRAARRRRPRAPSLRSPPPQLLDADPLCADRQSFNLDIVLTIPLSVTSTTSYGSSRAGSRSPAADLRARGARRDRGRVALLLPFFMVLRSACSRPGRRSSSVALRHRGGGRGALRRPLLVVDSLGQNRSRRLHHHRRHPARSDAAGFRHIARHQRLHRLLDPASCPTVGSAGITAMITFPRPIRSRSACRSCRSRTSP